MPSKHHRAKADGYVRIPTGGIRAVHLFRCITPAAKKRAWCDRLFPLVQRAGQPRLVTSVLGEVTCQECKARALASGLPPETAT